MARLGLFNVQDPYQVTGGQTTPQSNAGTGKQNINSLLPFFPPRIPVDPGVPTDPIMGVDPVTPDMPDPNAPIQVEPATSPDMPDPLMERPNVSGVMNMSGRPSSLVYGDQFSREGGGAGGGMAGLQVFTNPTLAMGSELLGKNVSQFDNGGMMNPYSSAVNSFRKALDNRIAAGKQLEGVVNMRKKRFTQGGRF
jgi:hypothetical protein